MLLCQDQIEYKSPVALATVMWASLEATTGASSKGKSCLGVPFFWS